MIDMFLNRMEDWAMKYNGFYFWMFKGPMKKVLAKKYGKAYVLEVMKKSKQVYRELVEQADDIGDDNPMAYNWHTMSCLPWPLWRRMWQAGRKFHQRRCRK